MATHDLGDYAILFERQGGLCVLCNEPILDRYLTHVDLIERAADGGTPTDIDNKRLICFLCDQKREGNVPHSAYPELRAALDQRIMWLRLRMRVENSIRAAKKSPNIGDVTLEELERELESIAEHEHYFEKLLAKLLKRIPFWREHMNQVHGIGPITGALLLSVVDINVADTVSSVWKYFGLAGPSRDRYAKGKKGGGSRDHRALLRQYAETQVRLRTIYRTLGYDKRRAKTDAQPTRTEAERNAKTPPPQTWNSDAHRHADACRVTAKLMLSHFWEEYRKFNGLSVRPPYAMEVLGHGGFITPQECGWPE